jgi:hypothetical protein
LSARITAWQCIGCGRIEGPQPCIGVCQDRKVEFVYAPEHDETLAELARVRGEMQALTVLIRQLAHTTPREGEWERTYRALQARARRALESLGVSGGLAEPRRESV